MRTKGQTLFDQFLAENGIGLTAAGQELKVTASTVLALRRGQKRPKPPLARRIEKWTGGSIAPDAWLTKSEQQEIESQEPHTSAAT